MRRVERHCTSLNLTSPPYIFLRPLTYGYDRTQRDACVESQCDPQACRSFTGPFSDSVGHDGAAELERRSEERATSFAKYYG